MDLERMCTAAEEVEQIEGGEEMDRMEMETDD